MRLSRDVRENRDDIKYELMTAINEAITLSGLTLRAVVSATGGKVSLATLSRIHNYECDLLKLDKLFEALVCINLFVVKQSVNIKITLQPDRVLSLGL